MNLFEDSFSLWRWQGESPLPLHSAGHEVKLRQLKEEFEQLERPDGGRTRPPRWLPVSYDYRRRKRA